MTGTGRKSKRQRAAAVRADVVEFIGRMQYAINRADIAKDRAPRRAARYLMDTTWDLFQRHTAERLSRDAAY